MSKLKSAILSVVGPRLFPEAKICSNQELGEHFRLIEMESESLMRLAWSPGDRVQVNTGDWRLRTYTPLVIDTRRARMQILTFLPGHGPGSAWASSAKMNDVVKFKGPDGSIQISDLKKPILLFGDETSLGLAAGLSRHCGKRQGVQFVFEVSAQDEVRRVLENVGVDEARLAPKVDGVAIHSEVLDRIFEYGDALKSYQVILSGRAQSIQVLRTQLRKTVPSLSITVKPYWSQGKTGLD